GRHRLGSGPPRRRGARRPRGADPRARRSARHAGLGERGRARRDGARRLSAPGRGRARRPPSRLLRRGPGRPARVLRRRAVPPAPPLHAALARGATRRRGAPGRDRRAGARGLRRGGVPRLRPPGRGRPARAPRGAHRPLPGRWARRARQPLRRPRVRHRPQRGRRVARDGPPRRRERRRRRPARARLVALPRGRGAARPRVEHVAGAAPAEGRVTLPFGVGALGVAYPAVLAALLGLPLFFVGASSFRLAAAGRALAAALVVLALAGLSLERAHPAAGTCVVAAIDVSASVGSAARETAREFLARLVPALGARDTLGAVAFAGRTRVLARPVAGRARLDALVPGGDLDDLEPDETDLAAALARATALCPDDQQAALLFFTDGNETAGSLLAEAALAEPRVPIYPVVPPPARLPMGTIRRLIAPPLAPAHAVLPLEAVVESRAAAPLGAALAVTVNGDALARWVAGGGALIAAGGAHLFGDGGFAGTALERVLPVEFQSERPEPREREPIALYLLIDRSNSMGYASGPDLPYGAKMEYAK